MVAQPALAALDVYAEVGRRFSMTGPRETLKMDGRINNSAPDSALTFSVGFADDEGTPLYVNLIQNGSDADSRGVRVAAYGTFRAVDGSGCSFTKFGEDSGELICNRRSYDWKVDTIYRLVFDRGNHTDKGWLWTVKLVNRANDEAITVVSFRHPSSRLASDSGGVHINNAAESCGTIKTVSATAWKPVVVDGTVEWQGVSRYQNDECNADLGAPLKDGKALLSIS